jgi:hypothetical protein
MPREIGRRKFFVEAKGYGFIRCQDGTDLFFHVSQTGGLYPNLERHLMEAFAPHYSVSMSSSLTPRPARKLLRACSTR